MLYMGIFIQDIRTINQGKDGKARMFRRLFCMDLKRSFSPGRFIAVVLVSALLLFVSCWDTIGAVMIWPAEERRHFYGAVDFLQKAMGFDVFKVVLVLLLSGLYTGSFCKDESGHYLRMILNRTNVTAYTWSRFLANLLTILTASIASCYLAAVLFMGAGFPVISEDRGLLMNAFYSEILESYPLIYIGMTGLQFGMVTAAFSSLGLLLSAYQPNAFVSVGASGFLFFMSLNFRFLDETPFSILALVGMSSTLPSGQEASRLLMFIWGMLYPLLTIAICCGLFERRMKWRTVNGVI